MSIDFQASPTVARFMRSDSFGRLIAGPVGSGKTIGCVVELLRRSIEQTPGTDGLSHTRFAIVRQTLKQLKDTVLKDAQSWLGGVGTWKVSENTFYIDFDRVRSEWIFIPLENAEDQARLLSMQLTGAWLSECIEMDLDVIGPISGRLGRYPSAKMGAPKWFGMIADTNFPTEMTPWHQFMENSPPNWQIFKQPSGLIQPLFDADGNQIGGAENLNHLVQTEETMKLPMNHPARLAQGRQYYERFVDTYGEDSDWVRRYVKAQYGDDPSGAAVFKNTFNAQVHLVDETYIVPGYPLIIGQDFGRNPWTLICQVDHMGRLLVHQELSATNVGLEKHIVEKVKPTLMMDAYLGHKIAMIGDPAGQAKGTIGEETSFEVLQRLGFTAVPAPTNDIEPRLRAVEALLCRMIGGKAGLVINRRGCPWLSRAMSGGYRFVKVKKTGALKTIPDKNDREGFSHVADCLQYVALVVHGGVMDYVASLLFEKNIKPREPMPASAWT